MVADTGERNPRNGKRRKAPWNGALPAYGKAKSSHEKVCLSLEQKIPFAALCLILDVMEELGLVTLQTSGSLYQIHLREIAGKVNLDDSVLLQKIRNQREKGGVQSV